MIINDNGITIKGRFFSIHEVEMILINHIEETNKIKIFENQK